MITEFIKHLQDRKELQFSVTHETISFINFDHSTNI